MIVVYLEIRIIIIIYIVNLIYIKEFLKKKKTKLVQPILFININMKCIKFYILLTFINIIEKILSLRP